MLLKRWEPISSRAPFNGEMDRIRRHMFRPMYQGSRFWGGANDVTLDVYKEGDNLVVRASVPGVKPEEVDVTINEDTLTITGEAKSEKEVKNEDYLHREHRYGSFRRGVGLPHGYDAAKADASYDNGILTVTISRSEESKSKSLKVNVKPS